MTATTHRGPITVLVAAGCTVSALGGLVASLTGSEFGLPFWATGGWLLVPLGLTLDTESRRAIEALTAKLKRVRDGADDVDFATDRDDAIGDLASEVDALVQTADEQTDRADVPASAGSDDPERSVGEDERRFRQIYERFTDGFFAIDPDWHYTYANTAGAELVDKDREDILGNLVWDVFPGIVDTPFEDALRTAMETQETQSVEAYYPPLAAWHDTTVYPAEDGLSVYFKDITERKEREEELKRYKEYTDDVLDAIDDVFYVLDRDGSLLRWNNSLPAVTGYSESDLASMNGTDFFSETDRETVATAIETVFETGSVKIEVHFETKGGDRIPYEFVATTVVDPDGNPKLVGVGRDVTDRNEYEQALASLHEVARKLLTTESEQAVADLVVDTAGTVLDAPAVGIYQLDTDANELVPTAVTSEFEARCGDTPSVTAGDSDSPLWNTFVTDEQTVVDGIDSGEQSPIFGETASSGLLVPLGDHGVLVLLVAASTFNPERRQLVETLAATTEAAFDRLRSEADLRQRDAELEAQNERLERQIQINQLIRSIDQSLINATTRSEIETAVCDRLIEDEEIAFAWIGSIDASGQRLDPRAWAGTNDGYLDAVRPATGSGEPSWQTADTGAATTVSNVLDALGEMSWATDALDRDFHSVVSVPVSFDEYAYGTLTVYADEPDAFGELERSVFSELGERIAHSINAVETQQALSDETALELELSVDSTETFLGQLARDLDCRIDFEGLATYGTDDTRLFFRTTGVDSAAVSSAVADFVAVPDHTLVSESDERCLFEVTLTTPVLAAKLARHGGNPRSISVDPDAMVAVVDLPQTTNVREFMSMLEEQYPSVDLAARRDVPWDDISETDQPSILLDQLTDRQREVLRTAYYAGFFETPRKTSADGIAEMLEVSQPTVSRHLRRGQQRLLTGLFDRRTNAE